MEVKARAKVDIRVNEDGERLIAKKGEIVTLEYFTPYVDDEKPHAVERVWNATARSSSKTKAGGRASYATLYLTHSPFIIQDNYALRSM